MKFCIVFRVVTSHLVSRTKNKYAASCHQIHKVHKQLICLEHFTDNIGRKYFCSALKQRLSNKLIYAKEIIVWGGRGFVEIIAVFSESFTAGISVNLKRIFFNFNLNQND